MDTQTLWSAALVVPAVVLTLAAIPARRAARTAFGLGLRSGGVLEFLRGCVFALPFLGGLVAVYGLSGAAVVSVGRPEAIEVLTVVAYFFVLMLVEEIVFRAMLMTGLGVVVGRAASLIITAVLVAGAYLFAPHTGVLPMVGAVITNLLHGWARWRSGRVWWGFGQRWTWNAGAVCLGFADSGFRLQHPLVDVRLAGPDWVTGGAFGMEGGLVGIAFLVMMLAGATRFATGSRGPWTISAKQARSNDKQVTARSRQHR